MSKVLSTRVRTFKDKFDQKPLKILKAINPFSKKHQSRDTDRFRAFVDIQGQIYRITLFPVDAVQLKDGEEVNAIGVELKHIGKQTAQARQSTSPAASGLQTF